MLYKPMPYTFMQGIKSQSPMHINQGLNQSFCTSHQRLGFLAKKHLIKLGFLIKIYKHAHEDKNTDTVLCTCKYEIKPS